jgi:hypothetical protein
MSGAQRQIVPGMSGWCSLLRRGKASAITSTEGDRRADGKPSFLTHHAKGTYHIKQAHSCVQAKVESVRKSVVIQFADERRTVAFERYVKSGPASRSLTALVSNETLFDDCHLRRGW